MQRIRNTLKAPSEGSEEGGCWRGQGLPRAAFVGKFSATVVAARARATHAFGPINSCDRTKGSLRIPAASGAARCGGSFGILQRIITGRCSRHGSFALSRISARMHAAQGAPPCVCIYMYKRRNGGQGGRRASSLFPPPPLSSPLDEPLIADLARINLF